MTEEDLLNPQMVTSFSKFACVSVKTRAAIKSRKIPSIIAVFVTLLLMHFLVLWCYERNSIIPSRRLKLEDNPWTTHRRKTTSGKPPLEQSSREATKMEHTDKFIALISTRNDPPVVPGHPPVSQLTVAHPLVVKRQSV
ncbi:unnamed protein product [Notodromas monacha]|uniref:Uncharacterized protein n=1 Tax=Notodromas monacha TaxID=399045 RepID=A0A7R9BYY1_9CRUS|nr:unnamed protein product [Notodromas monacha]CAG0923252.1 unnamed protein product [Notodromas monacha]